MKDSDIRGGSVGVYTTLDSTDAADTAKAKGLCTSALKADKSFREVRLYDSGGVEMYFCQP